MTATNVTLVAVTLVCAAMFFRPKLTGAPLWRATVTPLASIIGSGFLVAGPILAHAAGSKAWLAMTGLCALAYLFGAAIRHNIAHMEHGGEGAIRTVAVPLERVSELALALAYFVSVAYYLNLFAAFALRLWDTVDPASIRFVSSGIIAALGLVGLWRGLSGLERIEVPAVGVKLSLIGGLLAALALGSVLAIADGSFGWTMVEHTQGWEEIRILLGLVILVQGFETSRYLGEHYSAADRIRTMRWAQWISSGIYVVFILLITSYFTDRLAPEGGETAIIDMLASLGFIVAPLIIATALASQLSAAVADMNGAAGLLAESSGDRLSVGIGNLLTAAIAIAITWSANIYEIITYASKAFVIYYALQSALAAMSALQRREWVKAGLFCLACAIAAVIVLFAAPAEA